MSKKKSLEQLLNEIAVSVIYNQLKVLALDCFTWDGLPDGIQPVYIETALYNHGQAMFFDGGLLSTPTTGLVCLPCNYGGQRNIYNEPIIYRAFGLGVNAEVHIDNGVNIRNNSERLNMHEPLLMFASKIANVDRTADVNVRICKTPVILHGDDKVELSLKNMWKQIDENALALMFNKRFNMDDINVLQLTNNLREWFICAELMDYRNHLFNQALSFIGINNLPVDKKERLITDEANSNNEFVFNNIDARLQWRQNACEEINKMFGLSVSVKLKHEPTEPDEEPETDEDIAKEAGDSGEI